MVGGWSISMKEGEVAKGRAMQVISDLRWVWGFELALLEPPSEL